MRLESSILSISWIPSEVLPDLPASVFDRGVFHYDPPPPELVDDLDALRRQDRFRFANELTAWVEVDAGRVVAHGSQGALHMGATRVSVLGRDIVIPAVGLPVLRAEPDVREDRVTFTQTAGGRAGAPTPGANKPTVRWAAPVVWTTLSLTLHADGRVEHLLSGASQMPRHWVYDGNRRLVAKSGAIDVGAWIRASLGVRTPWGGKDSPAVVAAAETALERELSSRIMRAGRGPQVRTLPADEVLVAQDDVGDELFLVLDGVLEVDVDGRAVAEIGPGAVVGERAVLEGGRRTATLRTLTRSVVAVVASGEIHRADLAQIRQGHLREDHIR